MESNFLDALDRFRRGEMVIVVDDDDRENEGDLIMLAEHATAEKTAFMVRYTTGILCVAITAEHALSTASSLYGGAEPRCCERQHLLSLSIWLKVLQRE